jgi:sugar phosphate isomerase/epimerase
MHRYGIRIGTLVPGSQKTAEYIKQILPNGFESFGINFWQTLGDTDLAKLAEDVKKTLAGSNAIISHVSCFGNPLMDDDLAAQTRDGWAKLIDAAHLFGCDLVTGFTGRVVDTPIDKNIDRFAERYGDRCRSKPRLRESGLPTRTATWAATGTGVVGTSLTTRLRGR